MADRSPCARFSLQETAAGLALCRAGDRTGALLREADLSRRLRQGKRLLLARACRAVPGLRVLDGMAGFGLDGLTLARLGCRVTLCERDPLLFQVLRDGVARLAPELLAGGEVTLEAGDVRVLLEAGASSSPALRPADVVYLDPMFLARGKTALPNKRAAYLAEMLGPPEPLLPLLDLALSCAAQRVVVKRRRSDPVLGKPSHQLRGRSVRFDVYQAAAS